MSPYLLRLHRIPSKFRRLLREQQLKWEHRGEDAGSPPSDEPLDVVIATLSKDLATLPLALDSIRRFVRHPIGRIHLVSPPREEAVRAFAAEQGATFVDETTLISPAVRAFRHVVGTVNHTGWVLQQFLKLGADQLVTTRRFLVLDSDTAFVRPVVFRRDGRDVLYCSGEHHPPYFDVMRRLGFPWRFRLSFVAHHMMFDVELLRAMKAAIEAHAKSPWDQAILAAIDPAELSCFSEYETYGNYVKHAHPDRMTVRHWYNRSITRSGETLDQLVARYGPKFISVSMHSWKSGVDAAAPPTTA